MVSAGDKTLIYSIRSMGKEDLAQVNEIDREAFSTQWPAPNYRQELQNRIAYYVVACDDTRTVEPVEIQPRSGLSMMLSKVKLWLNLNRNHGNESSLAARQYIVGFSGIWVLANEAHITNIAVRQQYQRRGIGELLLISTIDLAKEHKASIMTLEVRASNVAAQNLYSKYGFTQVGIRRGCIQALRRYLGLTQREFSDRLGTRQQTISEWETGMYQPRGTSATLLSMIAERAKFNYRAFPPPEKA